MPTKTSWVPKKVWLVLAVAWTVFIAVMCLVSFDKLPSIASGKGADKLGHIAFHFAFTVLWYGYWENRGSRVLTKVVLASLAYGILIEFLQSALTTTRRADVYDVMANLTGALLATLAVWLWNRNRILKP